jgi:hypothetical protein
VVDVVPIQLTFLRSLKWLEPWVEMARLGGFVTFVSLALWTFRRPDDRRRATIFIGFVLIACAAAGVTQVEAWPFTTWALVHHVRSPEMTSWEMQACDETGRFFDVDPRVLQPMQPEEFGAWLFAHRERLSNEERERVLDELLQRAEEGRRQFLKGRFPPNDWLFGNLSAPAHFRARRLWHTAADVPQGPFMRLRIVGLHWDVDERERDPHAVRVDVMMEGDAKR